MVKIKRKVEMTQEEYAKYLIDKYGVSGFESELIDNNIIDAPMRFIQTFELHPVSKNDIPNGSFRNGKFTVEVEEAITEDTVFENLVEIYVNPEDIKLSVVQKNVSIKCVKNNDYLRTLAFYILNDDLTMTLVWTREKGLVE